MPMSFAYVIETEFGPTLQDAGVEIVIVDNDRKTHSKTTREAFAKFGIKVWPGAGVVGDRKMIAEFTGKTVDDLGGFAVNPPDCMSLDQSVNNTWKNNEGGYILHFESENLQEKTTVALSMACSKHGMSSAQSRCDSECNRHSTKNDASNN